MCDGQRAPVNAKEPVYELPDLCAPLDVARQAALVPATGVVKGMFFDSVAREVRAVSGRAVPGERRFLAFTNYPLRDWLEFLATAAATAYPNEPVRGALRRLGRSMYPAFSRSMVGKVVVAFASDDIVHTLPLYPKVWQMISDHASAEIHGLREGRVVIRHRNVWDFNDCFQVGSIEGGFAVFGKNATVRVSVLSPCDADFEVCW